MVKFLHSADLQLGARFSQFGAHGVRLREARLLTLHRTLALARKHEVDALLIAGDLFEDNQVDDTLVSAVIALFRDHQDISIYILPGNHDPYTGPDCVWQRKSFLNASNNVHIIREACVTAIGDAAFLLASPLHQKISTIDPSLKLVELARTLPAGTIKIGLTHGAIAIEAKHQPNDFPIALNAATRAGLDYLAIGHWHNWLAELDGGRMVMPGSPEPDSFSHDGSGYVALVEIPGHGQPPHVQRLPVATLTWRALNFDFLSVDASRASVTAALSELNPIANCTILRVTLIGTASPSQLAEIRVWLDQAIAPFAVTQVVNQTHVALSLVELTDLQARHPILAQVLADIDRMETLATGNVTTTLVASSDQPATPAPLTLAEVQVLLAPSKIELAHLTPELFAQLRQILLQKLQEVTP
jgi:DNA repair exonuclease SbcCD nuclease subunit